MVTSVISFKIIALQASKPPNKWSVTTICIYTYGHIFSCLNMAILWWGRAVYEYISPCYVVYGIIIIIMNNLIWLLKRAGLQKQLIMPLWYWVKNILPITTKYPGSIEAWLGRFRRHFSKTFLRVGQAEMFGILFLRFHTNLSSLIISLKE